MTIIQSVQKQIKMTNRQKRKRSIYGEMLDIISNTFLLYNSRTSLARATGYESIRNYKPLSYIRDSRQQEMLFLWLSNEEKCRLDDYSFDLNAFMAIYKITSSFYTTHLSRSRVFTPNKWESLFDMLDYCMGLKNGDNINYYVKRACDKYYGSQKSDKKISRTVINSIHSTDISLLILLIIGCIPSYNSQKGVGNKKHYLKVQRQVDISEEYTRISDFLSEYIKHGKVLHEIPMESIFNLSWDEVEDEFDIHRLWLWYEFNKTIMKYITEALIVKNKSVLENELIDPIKYSKILCGIYCITEDYIEVYTPKESEHYRISFSEFPNLEKLTIRSPVYVYSLLSIQQIVFPSIQFSIFLPTAKTVRLVGCQKENR